MMNMKEVRLATSSEEKEVTMTGEEMTEGGTGNMKGLIFIRPFEKRSYYVIPLGVCPSVNFFVSV